VDPVSSRKVGGILDNWDGLVHDKVTFLGKHLVTPPSRQKAKGRDVFDQLDVYM